MKKMRLNLRKVVAIAICLAGVTMFFGCGDKDDKADPCTTERDAYEKADAKYSAQRKLLLQGWLPRAFNNIPDYKRAYDRQLQVNDSIQCIINVDGSIQGSQSPAEQKALSAEGAEMATLAQEFEGIKIVCFNNLTDCENSH